MYLLQKPQFSHLLLVAMTMMLVMRVRVEVVVGDGDENAEDGDWGGNEVATVDHIVAMAAGGGD